MNPLKKKIIPYFLFFSLGLVVVLAADFYLFRRLKRTSSELLSTRRRLRKMMEEEARIKKWEKGAFAAPASLRKMKGALVDPEVPLSFLNSLEEAAEKAPLSYDISVSVPRGKKEKKGKFGKLEAEVETEGSFPASLRFLDYLENSPYLIKTERLSFSSPEGKSGVRMELLIQLVSYEPGKD